MDTYGIAATSMTLSAMNVQQKKDIAILKNAMDFEEQISQQLIQALSELPVGENPSSVDVSL